MKIKAALELSMRLGATHVFRTEDSFDAYRPAITIPSYFAWLRFDQQGDEYRTNGKWQLIHQLPKGASALE